MDKVAATRISQMGDRLESKEHLIMHQLFFSSAGYTKVIYADVYLQNACIDNVQVYTAVFSIPIMKIPVKLRTNKVDMIFTECSWQVTIHVIEIETNIGTCIYPNKKKINMHIYI